MKLFFDHYVKVGEELLWLYGNAHLSLMLADIDGEDQEAYRERIIRYVDSVFSEVRPNQGRAVDRPGSSGR
ncbi:hypothetical protein QQX98_011925, partial [Neonectria punicea]